eukprot:98537-Pelagomonas_calceolata.AAC.1
MALSSHDPCLFGSHRVNEHPCAHADPKAPGDHQPLKAEKLIPSLASQQPQLFVSQPGVLGGARIRRQGNHGRRLAVRAFPEPCECKHCTGCNLLIERHLHLHMIILIRMRCMVTSSTFCVVYMRSCLEPSWRLLSCTEVTLPGPDSIGLSELVLIVDSAPYGGRKPRGTPSSSALPLLSLLDPTLSSF